MGVMEGNCPSESPPPSAETYCANELNRSNSDVSTLTLEICEDILQPSADVKTDDGAVWTNERHSLYLEHLEDSFIKQLHQSMALHTQCSDQNKKDKNITQMHPINVRNSPKQFTTVPHGCRENSNCNRAVPLSHISPDPLNPDKSPRVHRFKRIGMHCPATSARMPELLMRCNGENQGKVIASHGSDTCSQQCSVNGHDDSSYPMTEGAGQNFVDEDNQTKSNTESQSKRLKTSIPY